MRFGVSSFALLPKLMATRPALLLTASLGALVGCVLWAPATGHVQTAQETKLVASDGNESDHLGSSVSVWGRVAVVGAYQDDHGNGADGYRSGSAYVYRFDGTGWVEEAKLRASDGTRENKDD
jgi:hypothetical protein